MGLGEWWRGMRVQVGEEAECRSVRVQSWSSKTPDTYDPLSNVQHEGWLHEIAGHANLPT